MSITLSYAASAPVRDGKHVSRGDLVTLVGSRPLCPEGDPPRPSYYLAARIGRVYRVMETIYDRVRDEFLLKVRGLDSSEYMVLGNKYIQSDSIREHPYNFADNFISYGADRVDSTRFSKGLGI